MSKVPTLDPAIRNYYETRPEETRLESFVSQMEGLRTRQLIQRFAPPPPAIIYDVGGAAGAYAVFLAELGYTVHLIDPVSRLVEEAKRRSARLARPIASCTVGDARALDVPAGSADIVLLLGPLYHLTEAEDRARALSEVRRILRPGGLLFAAGITRWAALLDGLSRDLYADPEYWPIAERGLRDGQHRNNTKGNYFTTAYFHRPEELRAEIAANGYEMENVFGLEGPAGLLGDFVERWADPRRRADLLRIAEAIETEPALSGLSGHMLAVARKPK